MGQERKTMKHALRPAKETTQELEQHRKMLEEENRRLRIEISQLRDYIAKLETERDNKL
jgi:regulator of replication initiation timing